jgi:uncharacterized protein YcbK (DUF882 family)
MKLSAMPEASLADHRLNRRRFLKWGALAGAMSLIPRAASARRSIFQPPLPPPYLPDKFITPSDLQTRSLFHPPTNSSSAEKCLSLYNTHTGEGLNAVYWAEGAYLPEALAAVDHVLRDHRTDEIKPIDPQLLDLLYAISEGLGCQQPFHIISGYRSPATNALLRMVSRGVAEHSMHMDGKAVDLRLPGWAAFTVRTIAKDLRVGGVGYYPRSEFVHVDVGPIRYW